MVERESVEHPFAVGSVTVPRAVRQKNGEWSVEFEINFRVKIDETRDVYVRRTLSVRATEQRGRRRVNAASEHQWVGPRPPIRHVHCSACGIIKRFDGKNSPTCKGPAPIGPRLREPWNEDQDPADDDQSAYSFASTGNKDA